MTHVGSLICYLPSGTKNVLVDQSVPFISSHSPRSPLRQRLLPQHFPPYYSALSSLSFRAFPDLRRSCRRASQHPNTKHILRKRAVARLSYISMALHRRLLQDIAEFQSDPYPNIDLFQQDDLQQACLVLSPSGKAPLHLTIVCGNHYPLVAPQITIQSQIEHPNVYGDYICASILNTTEGYTPAYTLKSVAIQLLSFFSSDRIEQEGGYGSVELDGYRHDSFRSDQQGGRGKGYTCIKCSFGCNFGGTKITDRDSATVGQDTRPNARVQQRLAVDLDESIGHQKGIGIGMQDNVRIDVPRHDKRQPRLIERVLALPDEILLQVFSQLDTQDLLAAAKVCSEIGDFMNSYDTIRMRELQCFCFKDTFMRTKLGVGVHINRQGKQGTLQSEFDLLSQQAFEQFDVRRSIQGLGFEHWLPLPLSRRHWRSVSADVSASLTQLAKAADIPNKSGLNIEVIYNFMSTVVVKLSGEAEQSWVDCKSTLTHASEKAIESYFSIYHLLLCLATEQDQIVRDANRQLQYLLSGHTSKESFPNLGQLLVTVLVSDQGLAPGLTLAIIKEAILRNVVWMLDNKGAGMAELSYIEPCAVSEYRLQRTFDASKTSYRLLMFFALFYRAARPTGTSLTAIRDELFDMHGAPPKGAAERMAAEIRDIRNVNSFPAFFKVMGLEVTPSKENFCTFLKRTIEDSVKMGYSRQPINQSQASAIRKSRDPFAQQTRDVILNVPAPHRASISFFPGKQRKNRLRR